MINVFPLCPMSPTYVIYLNTRHMFISKSNVLLWRWYTIFWNWDNCSTTHISVITCPTIVLASIGLTRSQRNNYWPCVTLIWLNGGLKTPKHWVIQKCDPYAGVITLLHVWTAHTYLTLRHHACLYRWTLVTCHWAQKITSNDLKLLDYLPTYHTALYLTFEKSLHIVFIWNSWSGVSIWMY